MVWIDIIKSLSTVLSWGVNRSHQHQEKNSCERWDSNPGLLGKWQVCYLCAMQPSLTTTVTFINFRSAHVVGRYRQSPGGSLLTWLGEKLSNGEKSRVQEVTAPKNLPLFFSWCKLKLDGLLLCSKDDFIGISDTHETGQDDFRRRCLKLKSTSTRSNSCQV